MSDLETEETQVPVRKHWITALRARTSNRSEQGFAIPVAVGMGLITILVASTMMLRSQDDQVTASAQKATADSLGVAETGTTRVQAALKKFPKIAEKSLNEWPAEYDRLVAINSCLISASDESLADGNWVNVDGSDLSKGEFKVLSYTYAENTGTLKVAGRARSESGSANTSVDNATTYLEIKVPVVDLTGLPVPGLWVTGIDMGNNDVSGNILINGCSIPSGVSEANIIPGTGSLNANPSIDFPPLPELPATICPSGTATAPCYQVFKQSTTYDPSATTADAITNSYARTYGTTVSADCLKDADGYVVKEDNQGDLKQVKDGGKLINECTEPSHYNESKAATFPRENDKAGSDGVYRYLLGEASSSNSNSIELKGGSRVNITAGEKVVFYLQGNINMTGQSKLVHTGSLPTNFQIYGSDGGTHYRRSSDTGTYTTTSVMLSGNTTAGMFIYAPEARAGVNGGGTATTSITGSVWTKDWDRSSGDQLVITQSAEWNTLGLPRPRSISSIQSWQRTGE